MQSATSFFNRALFRKNLQRFWPLWLGYVLIWLLLLPLPLLNELADYHGVPIVADVSYYLLQIGAYGGLVMGAVFGIFFAMAMFAYLTNPRATQGFHSMPVRRETLYATNYLTGLVCMVSALVLAFALAGITAACFGALNLTALGTALLAAVLSVLFFYSFAVLCMMFTGQILAAPVFYGTLNFLAVGMEYLVRTFAGNFLYGYSGYSAPETFAFLSPAWELVCVLDVSNVARVDRILSDGTYQVIRGGEYMLSGLGVLGIYAAVGIVLAVLGLLVYRRRASEATGSIVTVAWARPIFKYGVAVCSAFSLGQLIYFLVFGLNLHNGQYSLPGTIACMLFTACSATSPRKCCCTRASAPGAQAASARWCSPPCWCASASPCRSTSPATRAIRPTRRRWSSSPFISPRTATTSPASSTSRRALSAPSPRTAR